MAEHIECRAEKCTNAPCAILPPCPTPIKITLKHSHNTLIHPTERNRTGYVILLSWDPLRSKATETWAGNEIPEKTFHRSQFSSCPPRFHADTSLTCIKHSTDFLSPTLAGSTVLDWPWPYDISYRLTLKCSSMEQRCLAFVVYSPLTRVTTEEIPSIRCMLRRNDI